LSEYGHPQEALSIKRLGQDFERVVQQNSKEPKRPQWLIWRLDFGWV
jgi:hypothetical protein